MTNKPEGILVAEIRLGELFSKTLPAFESGAGRSVSLLSGATVLLEKSKKTAGASFRLQRPLRLAPPLDALAFQFEIDDYRELQAGWLAAIYGGTGLLFIAVTLWLSRRISIRLTGRLRILSDAARRIAESGSLEYAAEVRGSDEVTALATAFNAMVGKVRETRESLDRRVEERTGQLTRANAELNVEVRQRAQAEERVQRALREKEVMLKEIHHRVKNNMQVIYSLLNLQAKGVDAGPVRALFEESRDRVNSMALIHEQLYRSEDLAHIDFKAYLESLVQGVACTYKRPEIGVFVDMENLALDVNAGIPCGLIVNELVSNSFKHAFPAGRKGAIRVGMSRNARNGYILTVMDNGVGFSGDLDFRTTTSLGLQLVNVLTGQIHGTIELARAEGTGFAIVFPGPSAVTEGSDG